MASDRLDFHQYEVAETASAFCVLLPAVFLPNVFRIDAVHLLPLLRKKTTMQNSDPKMVAKVSERNIPAQHKV